LQLLDPSFWYAYRPAAYASFYRGFAALSDGYSGRRIIDKYAVWYYDKWYGSIEIVTVTV
jgi:hypothetical protein